MAEFEVVPTRRTSSSLAVLREILPDLAVLLCAAYALTTALGWPDRAALFPKYISIVLIVLVLLRIGAVVMKQVRSRGGAAADEGSTVAMDVALELRGNGRVVLALAGILVGFGIAVIGLGFTVGTAVASTIYVRFVARDSWLVALLTGLLLAGLIWSLISFFNLEFRVGLFF
ncbi:tripartite tricarboxylate transporter TctB family protein [Nocardioides pyridinolyticus]